MVATTYYPPEPVTKFANISIFLAGTIDNGNSADWQADFTASLDALEYKLDVFNPRRPDWDSALAMDIANESFRGQVEWELNHIDVADFTVMNFLPGSQSPITLLELGYIAAHEESHFDLLVCCPEGYWRRGNVQVMCARHNISLHDNMGTLLAELIERIETRYEMVGPI